MSHSFHPLFLQRLIHGNGLAHDLYFEKLRAREFARLDAQGDIYLDYTGGGLHGSSQVARHMEYLLTRCLLYTSPSPRDLSTSRMPSSA